MTARRIRHVAVALATALALSVVAFPGAPGAPDPASAAEPCKWTLHSKRVVKRKRVVVKGHKRFKKVKKTKKWWSCDPVADPPIEATPANRLLVRALDGGPFHFQLSRSDVSAGDVTVQLNNRSMDAHDLHLRPVAGAPPEYVIAELAPSASPQGSLAEDTFNLTPGNWYLWCDVLDHETWMHADLVVNP
jgi:hypothetical protein